MIHSARSLGDKIFDLVIILLLFGIVIVVAYPLWFVVIASFSDPLEVVSGRVVFLPRNFNIRGYELIINNEQIWLGYRNTILYTTVGLFFNMTLTTLGAYALACRTLPGRKVLLLIIMFTMYFSGGMIPDYLLVRNLGMLNTIWAMVLPPAVSVFNLIIMRTYFINFPSELLEAARIDGCSIFGALFKIVLPLSKPVLAVILLFYGVGHWNEFFRGMIYITDRNMLPLQLVLRNILLEGTRLGVEDIMQDEAAFARIMTAETMRYGAIIVSSVPVLLLYPFLQKYFVKGVMIGALKG